MNPILVARLIYGTDRRKLRRWVRRHGGKFSAVPGISAPRLYLVRDRVAPK